MSLDRLRETYSDNPRKFRIIAAVLAGLLIIGVSGAIALNSVINGPTFTSDTTVNSTSTSTNTTTLPGQTGTQTVDFQVTQIDSTIYRVYTAVTTSTVTQANTTVTTTITQTTTETSSTTLNCIGPGNPVGC